jgi:hypothetical protein
MPAADRREQRRGSAITVETRSSRRMTERTYFRHFADKREVLFEGEAELRAIRRRRYRRRAGRPGAAPRPRLGVYRCGPPARPQPLGRRAASSGDRRDPGPSGAPIRQDRRTHRRRRQRPRRPWNSAADSATRRAGRNGGLRPRHPPLGRDPAIDLGASMAQAADEVLTHRPPALVAAPAATARRDFCRDHRLPQPD